MEYEATLPRIIDLKDRDVPNGYELETAIEHTQPDGSIALVRQVFREIDLGDTYLTIDHMSRDREGAQTFLVFGTKGEVAGDFRTDRTEMIELRADGTVRRSEQTVKTWMTHEPIRECLRARYREGMAAGLSPNEVCQEIRKPTIDVQIA